MIISRGDLKATTLWAGAPSTWGNWPNSLELNRAWASYSALYRRQQWVRICVDKRAWLLARLPLKVYEHDDLNRPEAANHPYARLLARPNERHSRFWLWLWVQSTYDLYGEAFLGKMRDRSGRPTQLVPLHPTAMREAEQQRDGRVLWDFDNGKVRVKGIPDEDLFHPKSFNPDSTTRGLSKLESMRATLENEESALKAQSSFWRNGARPGTALVHPGKLSDAAIQKVKLQWNQIAAGADNYGTTVVLQEGMTPETLTLTAEEAQYIDARKLNREEVVAGYDMPPPAVHILDHATYSNITQQLRSVYRDTMAPVTVFLEAELEAQLRGSVRPGASGPDFGEGIYAEFLLDGVLRGDFEDRIDSYQKAINSAWMTPAEVRELENLPFLEGSDQLFINSTMIPLDGAGEAGDGAAEEPGRPPLALVAAGLDPQQMRIVMGRLSRQKTLAEIDPKSLVVGLNGEEPLVLAELEAARAAGEGVMALRERIKGLGRPDERDGHIGGLVKAVLDLASAVAAKETVIQNYVAPTKAPDVTFAEGSFVAHTTAPVHIDPGAVNVTVKQAPPGPKRRVVERDRDGNISTIVDADG
jgi:HK97 family phage portal protein